MFIKENTSLMGVTIIMQRLDLADKSLIWRSKRKLKKCWRTHILKLLSKNLFKRNKKLERRRRKRKIIRIILPIIQHILFIPQSLIFSISLFLSIDPGSLTVELISILLIIAKALLWQGQGEPISELVAARTFTQSNLLV